MAKRLLLVRHALPEGAPKGTFLGRTDVPVSLEGQRQAEALRPLLKRFAPDTCCCSPLLRARQTAEILLAKTKIEVRMDDDLQEIDFGQWEGRTFEEVASENARAVKSWANFDHAFSFPEGESLGGFLARMRRTVRRLADDSADTVLVVTHGGVIRSLICRLLRIRPRDYLLFEIEHATGTVIELFDSKGVLSGLNLRGKEEG